MAGSWQGFHEPAGYLVPGRARHRFAEEAEMANRLCAEIGRGEVQALDRRVRIVVAQGLHGAERCDRIVDEAQPANGKSHVVVVWAERPAAPVANIMARAAPARP